MSFSFSPSLIALPDQPVIGPARCVQYDELPCGGKFIPASLVGSDPAWNQSGLEVVDHGPGSLVDIEGSKVRVEAGEHLPHILRRRRRDCNCRATIRHASNGAAAGGHQLDKPPSPRVIQKPSEG